MFDFGQAEEIEPEAIGEPGKRTFRVRVLSRGEAASLWLEKEQLAALAMAIRRLLEQTGDSGTSPDAEAPEQGGAFPEKPQVDFKIGKLGIGYDEARRIVIVFAYEIGSAEDVGSAEDEEPQPTFSCRVTRSQCQSFADRAEEVISGGRPSCPLCSGPMEPSGHACVRSNGHTNNPILLND
jgi:uncharacterized repeat protein (TIGR03847 family)